MRRIAGTNIGRVRSALFGCQLLVLLGLCITPCGAATVAGEGERDDGANSGELVVEISSLTDLAHEQGFTIVGLSKSLHDHLNRRLEAEGQLNVGEIGNFIPEGNAKGAQGHAFRELAIFEVLFVRTPGEAAREAENGDP